MLPLLRFPAASLLNVVRKLNLPFNTTASFYHSLSKPSVFNVPQQNFLVPLTPNVLPNCGFKVMGKVRRRCKDCFFVRREERMYVLCKTHPRHKQMSMVKKPKNTWILTHASQSKVRPW